MDFIENYRLIQALRRGEPTDWDVYDAAAWSAPVELTENVDCRREHPSRFSRLHPRRVEGPPAAWDCDRVSRVIAFNWRCASLAEHAHGKHGHGTRRSLLYTAVSTRAAAAHNEDASSAVGASAIRTNNRLSIAAAD